MNDNRAILLPSLTLKESKVSWEDALFPCQPTSQPVSSHSLQELNHISFAQGQLTRALCFKEELSHTVGARGGGVLLYLTLHWTYWEVLLWGRGQAADGRLLFMPCMQARGCSLCSNWTIDSTCILQFPFHMDPITQVYHSCMGSTG